MDNVINKVIEIEDYNGNTILAFNIDEEGNIVQFKNASVADVDGDYIFETDKELIRIQMDE